MKKTFLLLVFCLSILYAQNIQRLITYDILFHDSSITYSSKKRLPSEQNFAQKLFDEVVVGKYFQFYGYDLSEVKAPLNFPVMGIDSGKVTGFFPPYDERDTVYIWGITINNIAGIRTYEIIDLPKLEIDMTGSSKKLIAWSFIIKLDDREAYNRIPYIFMTDKSYLPYLKQKLNK